MELKKQMYTNIHGVNKHLTMDYLDTLDWQGLLCNCHPLDRIDFKRKLELSKLI